jgi:hypothetical protein
VRFASFRNVEHHYGTMRAIGSTVDLSFAAAREKPCSGMTFDMHLCQSEKEGLNLTDWEAKSLTPVSASLLEKDFKDVHAVCEKFSVPMPALCVR